MARNLMMVLGAYACSSQPGAIPTSEVPERCSLVGSIPYWAQPEAFAAFLAHHDHVDHLSLFWYHLDPNGVVTPYLHVRQRTELVETAHAKGAKVLGLVANLPDSEREGNKGWDAQRVRKVLQSKARREQHIAELVALATRMRFDGLLIDYEALPRSMRATFSAFIEELGSALRARQMVLAVAIHPKTSERDPRETNGSEAQDWDALARSADQLHFMTYSQHTGTTPGPVASLDWFERVLRYAVDVRKLPRHKIFVGIPLYAEQWSEPAPGKYRPLDVDLTFRDVQRKRTTYDGAERWSDGDRSPYMTYRDREQVPQLVWFENRRSIRAKLAVASKLGLCNFAIWRLGGEDPGFWEELDAMQARAGGKREARAVEPSHADDSAGEDEEEEEEEEEEDEQGDGDVEASVSAEVTTARGLTSSGSLTVEAEYYEKFGFDEPEHERNNFLSSITFEQTTGFGEHLELRQDVRFVLESDGEDRRYYSDYPHRGIYLRELLLHYERGPVAVFGGRYEPGHGLHSHKAIFFGNYSTNLELYGQLGGGAAISVERDDTGRHTLTGHVFRRDTSRLRGEILSDQGRDHDIYGEVGDYGPPDSFLVTVDGEREASDVTLGYAVGGGKQTRGMLHDQTTLLWSAFGRVPLGGDRALQLSADGLQLLHAAGQDEDRTILGAGLDYADSRVSVGAAYSVRRVDYARMVEQIDRTDHIFELVASTAITRSVIAEIAYQHSHEWNASENAAGVAVKYVVDWQVE